MFVIPLLAKLIRVVAINRQIIISTKSETLLKELRNENIIVINKNENDSHGKHLTKSNIFVK